MESQVLLLRKGRLAKFADTVHLMLDVTPPIAVYRWFYHVNYLICSFSLLDKYNYLSKNNTLTKGELLDDFFHMFQIIKIYFSIFTRNIFCGIAAVFKEIRAWFRKKFISLLIISSILQQTLLYVSTLPPLSFKVPSCQHFCSDPPTHPLQSISTAYHWAWVAMNINNKGPPPLPKPIGHNWDWDVGGNNPTLC